MNNNNAGTAASTETETETGVKSLQGSNAAVHKNSGIMNTLQSSAVRDGSQLSVPARTASVSRVTFVIKPQ